MHIIRDLSKVFSANVVNILVGIVTGFLVPAFLPINAYADIKTFTLYVSYLGILHLGFIDGVFIKYGGERFNRIDRDSLAGEKNFLLIFQLAVTLLILAAGLYMKSLVIIALALSVVPVNMTTFYRNVFQSMGEFSIYTRIMYATSLATLFVQLFLLFIIHAEKSAPYVYGLVLINYFIFFALEILLPLKKTRPIWNAADFRKLFRAGIFIMIGNFSTVFYYSVDRLLVKHFFTTSAFAYYSFAISMLSAVNILITSLTSTLYPYLSRMADRTRLNTIKNAVLIAGTLFSGVYFVFEIIVYYFIKKYIPSLDIISILFIGFPAMVVVNVLYVNLYKIERKQKKYLATVSAILILSVCLMIATVFLFHDYRTISVVTTLSYYAWFIIAARTFQKISIKMKDTVFLIVNVLLFFLCSQFVAIFLNIVLYYLTLALLIFVFYRKDLILLLRAFAGAAGRRLQRGSHEKREG
ncbi:lipopolysaccharide biosynthesis protein [Sporolactobacillus sp. KGMB 08714]|uniref:lipopolysaccharide biosynthesis protein n=1 Tax=Sporolactobacillus sp. KGMB 08714 TaxID=3064704 RepID=UPI002FBD5518